MDILKGVSDGAIEGYCENESSKIVSYYILLHVMSAYFHGPSANKVRVPNRKIEATVRYLCLSFHAKTDVGAVYDVTQTDEAKCWCQLTKALTL